MLPKVLVVEDDSIIQDFWQEALSGKVELVPALNIKKAEQEFATNPDFAAIVMDGCVPGFELNTVPLVQKFRDTFKGPMIASSRDPSFREELVRAGCDHECDKYAVPDTLCEIIGL